MEHCGDVLEESIEAKADSLADVYTLYDHAIEEWPWPEVHCVSVVVVLDVDADVVVEDTSDCHGFSLILAENSSVAVCPWACVCCVGSDEANSNG